MKTKTTCTIKTTVLCVIAGIAAVKLAQEVPAMVRYYRMKKL